MVFLNWLLARLGERETWVGLVGLLSAGGVSLAPDQAAAIATAGTAVVGAILVVTKQPPSGGAS